MTPAARTATLSALLVLAACGDAPGDAPANDGARLYVVANCTTCHGAEGKGGPLGPPLRGLAANWTRDTLADYLADPKAVVARDPRLAELDTRFSMPMPPVAWDRDQRLILADHVLGLSAAAR